MSMEILVRNQNGTMYSEFELPLEVMPTDKEGDWWHESDIDFKSADIVNYELHMGENPHRRWIGTFKERRHAIHVMNYLLAKRNYYKFDNLNTNLKTIILDVPLDETVRQTPNENLLDGFQFRSATTKEE